MRPLSFSEKEAYVTQMKKFVSAINVLAIPIGLEIMQVTYLIPIDHEYFYFDYPWSKEMNDKIVELNDLLSDDKQEIAKNTKKVLEYFTEYNNSKKKKIGYIYYEYTVKGRENKYAVANIDSNFLTKANVHYLLNYLPLIHFGCFLENDYNVGNVHLNKEVKSDKKLLTIYKSLSVNSLREDDDNTIVCSFICNKYFDINNNKHKNNIPNLLTILESYFDSPVLNKILKHQRKSYILGYKHNLDNLYLKSEANRLLKIANIVPNDKAQKLIGLNEKLKVADLNHSFLFDYEMLDYLEEEYLRKYPFRFKNKTLNEIFDIFFNTKAKYKDVTQLNGLVNYTPELMDKRGNYMMSDLCLTLWNLWINACSASMKYDNIVEINLQEENDFVSVEIINFEEMPEKMQLFINGIVKKHPKEEPTRPYRGWTIILDIISQNRNISLHNNFGEKTIITLKIKK